MKPFFAGLSSPYPRLDIIVAGESFVKQTAPIHTFLSLALHTLMLSLHARFLLSGQPPFFLFFCFI